MTHASDDPQKPRLPDAKRRSAWLRPSLRNPGLKGLLVAGFLVALALTLYPSILVGTRLPEAGSIAERDFRAPQGFAFKVRNPELERERQEAEDKVRPLYRHQADKGEVKSRAVAAAFRHGRRALQDHDERGSRLEARVAEELRALSREEERLIARLQAPIEPEPTPGPSAEGASPDAEPGSPDAGGGADARAELQAQLDALRARRSASEREAELERVAANEQLADDLREAELMLRGLMPPDAALRFDDKSFAVLIKDRFSVFSEDAVQEVVETVMTRRVVRDLERLGERLQDGIQVVEDDRTFGARDMELFWELGTARQRGTELLRERLLSASPPADIRLQAVLAQLVSLLIEENFAFDPNATAKARAEVRAAVPEERTEAFLKGQTIIESGQRVTSRHVELLQQMQLGEPKGGQALVLAGILALLVCLFGLVWSIGIEWRKRLALQPRDVLLFGTVTLVQFGLLRLSMAVIEGVLTVWPALPPLAMYYALPLAMGAMLVRLFTGVAPAVAFAVVQSLLVGVLFQGEVARDYVWPVPLVMVLYSLSASVLGTFFLREVRQRTSLLLAGVKVGVFAAVLALCLHLIGGGTVGWELASLCLGGLAGGVLAYFAIIAITPVLESALGYATDIKLLELANMNQPALKELSMRAPGTYHHSIMVGNLAEAAAEAIGANPLMTRVGAYYHDLGKMRNPRYFAENQSGENPHDRVKPHMSALIIKAHVKDGIEIARRYRLPQDIIDFVPQHHGSALIGFFYARAKDHAAAHGEQVDESDFRYPGPKPQRKETALVMLADGVEASARSLPDPNPAALKGLVKKIVNGKFIDGQLDECALTVRDLKVIVECFNRMLISIYHGRPEYPPIPGEADRARDQLGLDDSSGATSDAAEAPEAGRAKASGSESGEDGGGDASSPAPARA